LARTSVFIWHPGVSVGFGLVDQGHGAAAMLPELGKELRPGEEDRAGQAGLSELGSPPWCVWICVSARRSGAADDIGECGHAELDGGGSAPEGGIDLGELVLGAGEADPESFDLAEPAFLFGFGDAGVEVVADLDQPRPLFRICS